MSAKDLTTLAKVKAWMSILDANSDALLGDLITRASVYIVNFVNREIKSGQFQDVRNGNGRTRFMTSQWPVTAVSSVSVGGVEIPLSPDGVSYGYLFDDKCIYLFGAAFDNGVRNIKVSYTAGYATVPEDIEQAVIELVAYKYKARQRVGVTSETLNGMVTAFSQSDLSADTKDMLNNYQRKFSPR